MKFRAIIEEGNLVKSLIRTIQIFSKQSNELVLRLNKTHMCFISKVMREGVVIYAKLPVQYMFTEYCCEGVNQESDEIYLVLDSEKLIRILKQINSQQCKSIKFKLSQKGQSPYIEISIEQQSNLGVNPISINYDVPIELLSRNVWNLYDEVIIPESEDIFYLPPIKHVKNVVDKQKNFNQYIKLFLKSNNFTLKTKHDLCEITTVYPDITYEDPDYDPVDDSEKMIELSGTRLAIFLNSLDVNPNIQIAVNISDQNSIQFSFTSEQVTVNFTLPHMLNN